MIEVFSIIESRTPGIYNKQLFVLVGRVGNIVKYYHHDAKTTKLGLTILSSHLKLKTIKVN